jgi:hypothetical protein
VASSYNPEGRREVAEPIYSKNTRENAHTIFQGMALHKGVVQIRSVARYNAYLLDDEKLGRGNVDGLATVYMIVFIGGKKSQHSHFEQDRLASAC